MGSAVLRTERLELVLLDPATARLLAAGRPDGRPWADGYPLGSSLLRAELTVAAAAQERPLGDFGTYQVVRREDGKVIGDVGFMGPPDETGAVSLLCSVALPSRGRGYATEALRALLAWASGQAGLTCVLADTTRSNTVARRLLERVGFRPVGGDGELRYYML
jgi:RimJ/RimL family protein N-acetyltransferase